MSRRMVAALGLGAEALVFAVLVAVPDINTFWSEWVRYAHNEAIKAHDLRYVGGGPVLAIGAPDWRLLITPLLAVALFAAAGVTAVRAHLRAPATRTS